MRKFLLLFTIAFTFLVGNAQITTTSLVEKKKVEIEYDSTYNFPGRNIEKFLNQTFYVLPLSESLREYGYEKFKTKPSRFSRKDIYKPDKEKNYVTDYESLQGDYLKFIEYMDDGIKRFMVLESKNTGDIIYYLYDPRLEHSFPFLTVGYYEKLKKEYIGEELILRPFKFENLTDYKTGEDITLSNDEPIYWFIRDVTLDEKYFNVSFILKNDSNQEIMLKVKKVLANSFHKELYENIKSKYPETAFKILNGGIAIGMSEEEVLLSWGAPKSKNISSYGDQWVYDGQYLYFENGKLKSYN